MQENIGNLAGVVAEERGGLLLEVERAGAARPEGVAGGRDVGGDSTAATVPPLPSTP